jgi:hypothetical protein
VPSLISRKSNSSRGKILRFPISLLPTSPSIQVVEIPPHVHLICIRLLDVNRH